MAEHIHRTRYDGVECVLVFEATGNPVEAAGAILGARALGRALGGEAPRRAGDRGTVLVQPHYADGTYQHHASTWGLAWRPVAELDRPTVDIVVLDDGETWEVVTPESTSHVIRRVSAADLDRLTAGENPRDVLVGYSRQPLTYLVNQH